MYHAKRVIKPYKAIMLISLYSKGKPSNAIHKRYLFSYAKRVIKYWHLIALVLIYKHKQLKQKGLKMSTLKVTDNTKTINGKPFVIRYYIEL